jgi:uncharacterized protein YacL
MGSVNKNERKKELQEKKRREKLENLKNLSFFLFNPKEVLNFHYKTLGIHIVVLVTILILAFVLTVYLKQAIIGMGLAIVGVLYSFIFVPEKDEIKLRLFNQKRDEWYKNRYSSKEQSFISIIIDASNNTIKKLYNFIFKK